MKRLLLVVASLTLSTLALILVLATVTVPTIEPARGLNATVSPATTAIDAAIPQLSDRLAEGGGWTNVAARTSPYEEKKVVREGNIRIVTDNVDEASKALLAFLGDIGGYVERDEGAGGRRTIYARVPAHSLEDFLSYVSGLGRVASFKLSAEDVTELYVDLKARLNASMALERRLLALLGKAASIEDVLKVERELRRVRAEIESLRSRLEVLEKRIKYSLVIVELVPSSLSYNVIFRVRSGNAEELASRVVEAIRSAGSVTSINEEKGSIIVRGKVQTAGLEEVVSILAPYTVERTVRAVQDGAGWSTLTIIVERVRTSRAITWIVEADDVEGLFRSVVGNEALRKYITSFDLTGKEARILLDVPNDSLEGVLASLPQPSEVRESSYQGPLSTVSVVIRESRNPVNELASSVSYILMRGLVWIVAALALSLPTGIAAMLGYMTMRATWRKIKRIRGERAG